MSLALYEKGGLRFWTEEEILVRNQIIDRSYLVIKNLMQSLNPAWKYARVEGPTLTPMKHIHESYTSDDVFVLNSQLGEENAAMRPETTKSSYVYAEYLLKHGKPPLCVWQSGKSYRVERSDGASASKMRFNEFYQLEFQHIYSNTTKMDYRPPMVECVEKLIASLTGLPTRVVESDRLPKYSSRTQDVEILWSMGENQHRWTEMCSISTRTDFSESMTVLEVAMGLDRLVCASMKAI